MVHTHTLFSLENKEIPSLVTDDNMDETGGRYAK
jgi:hypothetical protein